jgi:hypothetical protein
MYINPTFSKFYRIQNIRTTSEWVRKISASGARFCRQYSATTASLMNPIREGEGGVSGLLCTFIFSIYTQRWARATFF